MFAKIFGDASFWNTEIIGEQRFQVGVATTSHSSARKVSDRDTQRVASFYVVVGRHVVIGEDEDTWAGRSMSGLIKLCSRTGQQAAQLHFKKRKTRSKTGIAEASLHAGSTGIGNGFNREPRYGAAVQ